MDGFTEVEKVNFVPALVATGVWLGVGAALDAYLVASRKDRVITDVLRTKPGKVFLAVLCLHVANLLGRADPFSAVAAAIRRGEVIIVPVPVELSDALTGE